MKGWRLAAVAGTFAAVDMVEEVLLNKETLEIGQVSLRSFTACFNIYLIKVK